MSTNLRNLCKTPTNKIERALLIAQHWRLLSPIPEGCRVSIVPCACPPQFCDCEVELKLEASYLGCASAISVLDGCVFSVQTWNDGGPEPWLTDEADPFCWRMLEFLRAVDPTHYPDVPEDETGIPWIDHGTRIAAMTERVSAGFSAKSQADNRIGDLKVGGEMGRNRNGSVSYYGVEEFPDVDDD